MVLRRLLLITALLVVSVPASADAKSLAQAQAQRYAKTALSHRFGKSWRQRDRSVTYFKCRRKATLTFQCRVVWLRNIVVYDGHVGISLRPDPADDGWYYDFKIRRSNYGCSDLCRKTVASGWTRGGSTSGSRSTRAAARRS